MAFSYPIYHAPDFTAPHLAAAPDAAWAVVERDGIAPAGFHSTSMYPEYFKIGGQWRLAAKSRMDSSVVLCPDGTLSVVENRNLKRGDMVCFDTVSDSDACDHTGIYLGNGYFIHASSAAKKVILSSLSSGYYKRTFSWGRRVFD